MKISVNNEHLLEINELQRKIICNDICHDIFDADMKRRIKWVIEYWLEGMYKEVQAVYLPDIQNDMLETASDGYLENALERTNAMKELVTYWRFKPTYHDVAQGNYLLAAKPISIEVNSVPLFEIPPEAVAIFQYRLTPEEVIETVREKIKWVLEHKHERCQERLLAHWRPLLANRLPKLPSDCNRCCELVFAQKDYKCRKTREDKSPIKEKI